MVIRLTDEYSLEETLTNKVFLGKKVYRKVISVNSGPNAGSIIVPANIGINVVDTITNLHVIWIDTASNTGILNAVSPDAGFRSRIFYSLTKDSFDIYSSDNGTGRKFKIIMEYTKK